MIELFAVGDAELLAHQVDAGGLLGDGMLHLQAGVDLQERDQTVLADEVFHGARAVVAGLLADPLGGLVDLLALRVGEEGRRCFFDEFLEAALQRAVAGARDDDVAVLIGDHLGLDVARLVEVALDEALAAAEGRDRLAGGRIEQFGDLLEGAGDLHAATAAAEGRLDRDRHAVLAGERHHLVGVLDRIGRAGHQGSLRAGGDMAGGDLVAEIADGLRAGPDPDQPGVDDGLGEVGVLGEEPVARVDGVGAGFRRGVEDLAEVQVGLRGGLPTQGEGLIGQAHVRGVGIRLGIDRHTAQTGILGRPDHPHRDFTAVGDEDLGDGLILSGHRASCGLLEPL